MLGALEGNSPRRKEAPPALIERRVRSRTRAQTVLALLGQHCTPGRIGKSHRKARRRPVSAAQPRHRTHPPPRVADLPSASARDPWCRRRASAPSRELYALHRRPARASTRHDGGLWTARAHFWPVNRRSRPGAAPRAQRRAAGYVGQLPDGGSTASARRPTRRRRRAADDAPRERAPHPAAESATINTILFVRPDGGRRVAPPARPPAPAQGPLRHLRNGRPRLGPRRFHPPGAAGASAAARAPALVAAPPTAARVPTMSIGGVGRPGSRASLLPPGPGIGLPASPLRPARGAVACRPPSTSSPGPARAPRLPTPPPSRARRPPSRRRRRRRHPRRRPPPRTRRTRLLRRALRRRRPGERPFGAEPANPANGVRRRRRRTFVPAARRRRRPGGGGLPSGPGGLAPWPPTIPSMPPSFSSARSRTCRRCSSAFRRRGPGRVRLPSPMAPRPPAPDPPLAPLAGHRRRAGPSPGQRRRPSRRALRTSSRRRCPSGRPSPPRCRRSCRSRWSARVPSDAAARGGRRNRSVFLHIQSSIFDGNRTRTHCESACVRSEVNL